MHEFINAYYDFTKGLCLETQVKSITDSICEYRLNIFDGDNTHPSIQIRCKGGPKVAKKVIKNILEHERFYLDFTLGQNEIICNGMTFLKKGSREFHKTGIISMSMVFLEWIQYQDSDKGRLIIMMDGEEEDLT